MRSRPRTSPSGETASRAAASSATTRAACSRKLAPASVSAAPRGTAHNFRNTAETPSRILLGFTPGGIEDFFRESGQPATDDGRAPVDEDEIARMMAAAPKYGVEIVAVDN